MYKGGGRKGNKRVKRRRSRKTQRKAITCKKGYAYFMACFLFIVLYAIIFAAAIVIIKDVQIHTKQKMQVIENLLK